MADVKSKNLYELLGNDHDEDSDREPEPPTRAIEKPTIRKGKRDTPDVVPARGGAGGGRGGGRGFSGNEGAYRDRNAGRDSNRDRPVDDSIRGDRHPRRGGAPRRGGRGATFKDDRDDKRSHGRPNEHVKQADASWGGASGGAEWEDERAGEAIANADAKDPQAAKGPDGPTDAEGNAPAAPEPEPEPEDNSKSYADYLAERLAKAADLATEFKIRKPNEGSKDSKKWAGATELKDDDEDQYMAAKEGKAGRQRQRKQKETVEIDHRFVEQPRSERGGRGRGGPRGEYRGRGEGRGRGGGGGGRGEGRGEGRGGGAGGGDRGDYRGPRGGGRGGSVNVSDKNAFPSLGADAGTF